MTTTATPAPTSATPTSTGTPPGDPKAAAPAATPPEPKAAPKPAAPAAPKAAEPKAEEEVDLLSGDSEGTAGSDATASEIELSVPDGVEVDKGMMDGFKEIAKGLKLDSKGAQKLLDYYVGNVQKAEESIKSNWEQTKTQWRETAKKDPEIGGANYKQSVDLARKAIDKLGGPSLVKALRDLDLGAHPEIIRFAYRVGKALSDDTMADLGGKPVKGADDPDAMYRAAFPSMYKADKDE